MKKIFALISALVISVAAFAGYYNYDPTEITSFKITDESYGNSYSYTIEVIQSGKNGSWFESEATFYLYPDTHSFVGEFTVADFTLDNYSYVYYNKAYRYFVDTNSYWSSNNQTKITITDNGDGTYTFGGVVICNNGSNYYRYLYTDYQFDLSEPDPFEKEPATQNNWTCTMDNLDVDTAEGATPIDIYAYDAIKGGDIDLRFNVESYDIPAGEYEISDSGANGTILAADGSEVDYYDTPSYYHNYNYDTYYLVSGTLTVSYSDGNMIISGTATTAHGSTVEIYLTGKDPFGHALADPVLYEANKDGETATVIGVDNTFTGDAITIASVVNIAGKDYTVTSIADQAFTRKTGIKSVVIPASIEVIGKAAFSFCTGIESIECQGAVAPSLGATAFYKINPAITVLVPASSVDAYKAADGWKMFTGISAK